MKKFLVLFFTICCIIACGDNALLDSAQINSITNKFFLVPSSEKKPLLENQIDSIFTSPAETLFVRSAAIVEDEIVPGNQLSDLFFTRFWLYKGFMLNEETIRVLWNNPGKDTLCHFSIDLLGDTLRHCIPVFINAKAMVQNLSPKNGINHISRTDTLEFQWEISGLDSWEKAECAIYFSPSEKELWNSTPKKTPCFKPFKISASNFSSETSNAPLYFWGIQFKTYSTHTETAYSAASSFRLKSKDSSSAFIIPIRYANARSHYKEGILKVSLKDSVLKEYTFSKDTTFVIQAPSEGIPYKFSVKEMYRTDYIGDSTEAIAEKGIFTTTDTLILKDVIAPEAIPLKNAFAITDSIQFFAAENGSGLNGLRSAIILLNSVDTIPYTFSNSKFAFTFECENSCDILIHLEDNAKNQSPNKIWNIQFSTDSIFVTGPYFSGDSK